MHSVWIGNSALFFRRCFCIVLLALIPTKQTIKTNTIEWFLLFPMGHFKKCLWAGFPEAINKPVWDPEKLLILTGVEKQRWRPDCGLCCYPGKSITPPPTPPPTSTDLFPWPVPSFTASLPSSIHPSISPHPNPASQLTAQSRHHQH